MAEESKPSSDSAVNYRLSGSRHHPPLLRRARRNTHRRSTSPATPATRRPEPPNGSGPTWICTRRPLSTCPSSAPTRARSCWAGAYDLIVISLALHYVLDPSLLCALKRAMRPGSLLCVTLLSPESLLFDARFNRHFFTHGQRVPGEFGAQPFSYHRFDVREACTRAQLSALVRRRCWSGLRSLSNADVGALTRRIPRWLTELALSFDAFLLRAPVAVSTRAQGGQPCARLAVETQETQASSGRREGPSRQQKDVG